MEPFIGQIIMFGGNFAPRGWALCNGQLLSINENPALFSILGTTYGGDGRATFALPDLRGRAPVHAGAGPGLSPKSLGEKGGGESAQLTIANLPEHGHTVSVPGSSDDGNQASPANAQLAAVRQGQGQGQGRGGPASPPYNQGGASDAALAAFDTGATGGSTPFSTRSPYQAVNFIIALQGLFPVRD